MSEEVKNEEAPVYPIVAEPKPVLMRKGGQFLEVGEAIVTKHEGHTEIVMVLNKDADEFGELLVANDVMTGVIIGGRLNPEILGSLNKQGDLS